MQLDHVNIQVYDLPAAHDFLVRLLGVKVGWCPSFEVAAMQSLFEKKTPLYLGTATMADDGTTTVSLNRRMTGKTAEEITRYVSGDPSYNQVFGHVGGLKPGETKPVLSWPPGS